MDEPGQSDRAGRAGIWAIDGLSSSRIGDGNNWSTAAPAPAPAAAAPASGRRPLAKVKVARLDRPLGVSRLDGADPARRMWPR